MTPQRKRLNKIHFRIEKLASGGKEFIYDYINLIDELIDKGDYSNLEQALNIYYSIDISKYKSIEDVKRNTWNEILFQTNSSLSTKLKKVFDSFSVYQQGQEIWDGSNSTLNFKLIGPLSSTYSSVLTTQILTFSQINNSVYVTSSDSNIYEYEIWKSDWATQSGVYQPIQRTLELFQTIQSTQSSYKTEISSNHGRDYLVVSKTRNQNVPNSFHIYNWNLSITINSFLGEIKERDIYSDESKYLYQNEEFARIIGTRKTYLDVTKGTYSVTFDYTNPNWNEQQNYIERYRLAINYLKA